MPSFAPSSPLACLISRGLNLTTSNSATISVKLLPKPYCQSFPKAVKNVYLLTKPAFTADVDLEGGFNRLNHRF
jgi:hypothetical protein